MLECHLSVVGLCMWACVHVCVHACVCVCVCLPSLACNWLYFRHTFQNLELHKYGISLNTNSSCCTGAMLSARSKSSVVGWLMNSFTVLGPFSAHTQPSVCKDIVTNWTQGCSFHTHTPIGMQTYLNMDTRLPQRAHTHRHTHTHTHNILTQSHSHPSVHNS